MMSSKLCFLLVGDAGIVPIVFDGRTTGGGGGKLGGGGGCELGGGGGGN